MKPEELSNAIGRIDDKLITAADKVRTPRKRRPVWVRWVAMAACLCLIAVAAVQWGVTGWEPGDTIGGETPSSSTVTGEVDPDGEPSGTTGGETQSSSTAPGEVEPDRGPAVPGVTGGAPATLAAPVYLEMEQFPVREDFDGDYDAYQAQYDRWSTDQAARLNQSWTEGYSDGVMDFTAATMAQFLSRGDGENQIYSPLNLYFALGMMAELTAGNGRAQILNLLGVDTVETLRTKASALWLSNYCDDGTVTSLLANSLWLNQDVSYFQSTMDTLANSYYASAFRGDMASEEYEQMFKDWLNAQTGGLFQEQVDGRDWLNEELVLALASTIYYRARWVDEFAEEDTKEGTFHAPGGDILCDFMHQERGQYYYWGNQFSAVSQSLDHSGSMWLILPDEGTSVDELLADGEFLDMISAGWEWADRKYALVRLAMPKFDVTSSLSLSRGLQALGITDVFDSSVSDFTPMTEDNGINISEIQHAARVMVDEEGCIAAAYTVELYAGAPLLEGEVDFVLDRPFLFVITGLDGSPLFVGVVNQPTA